SNSNHDELSEAASTSGSSMGMSGLPGRGGADAFTIRKLAGHSSATVSQRYVHPTPESVGFVFDRLEALNRKALDRTSGTNSPQNPPQRDLQAS
ncbi:MAG: hypothetical protein WAK33_06920, partial [Silvibacterium sp.]